MYFFGFLKCIAVELVSKIKVQNVLKLYVSPLAAAHDLHAPLWDVRLLDFAFFLHRFGSHSAFM